MSDLKVYLGGPDVFHVNSQAIAAKKKIWCDKYGLVGLDPVDGKYPNGPNLSSRIFEGNLAMMAEADAMIANLSPFRGPSADVGTVWECAHMYTLNKPVVGYANFPRGIQPLYAPRVRDHYPPIDYHNVEDFGLSDNLMLAHSLNEFYPISDTASWEDLTAFHACVQYLADFLR